MTVCFVTVWFSFPSVEEISRCYDLLEGKISPHLSHQLIHAIDGDQSSNRYPNTILTPTGNLLSHRQPHYGIIYMEACNEPNQLLAK